MYMYVGRQGGGKSEKVENICGKHVKQTLKKKTLSESCSLLSHTMDC